MSTASRPVQKVNSLINGGLSISNPIKALNSPTTHSTAGRFSLSSLYSACSLFLDLQLVTGHSPHEIYSHIGATTASLKKLQTMTD